MKVIFLIFSALISFSLSAKDIEKMTAIELVNDMGLGWNLGNTFDCFGDWKEIKEVDDQVTMWGNSVPTEKMVTSIQKHGFKTVRFPVTWMYFMDSKGNVKEEFMKRVKEVVDWIYESEMYVILNVHHDGVSGNWLSKGVSELDKYKTLWKNIADEFKTYDRRLILESMNEVEYKSGSGFDFKALNTLTQAFVDVVRASGGNNANRLLLISGANTNLEQTCSDGYLMPTDKAKMLAVSIHYYLPPQFAVESDKNPWTWTDEAGAVHEITPMTKWGTESDYKEMVNNFETMKTKYTSKGIPVILGEVGVLTEEKKDPDSIREYLTAEYSFSADYDGIMSCLWDTSKNTAGDMNFFNRETERWYDEKLQNNLIDIANGKYVHPTEFYASSNKQTADNVDADGNLQINIGTKKVKKIIFNANIEGTTYECGFGVASSGDDGEWFGDPLSGGEGVKQADGSYTFTVDPSSMSGNLHDYIQVQRWWGNEQITLNYVTIEFEGTAMNIDYKAYKAALKK